MDIIMKKTTKILIVKIRIIKIFFFFVNKCLNFLKQFFKKKANFPPYI